MPTPMEYPGIFFFPFSEPTPVDVTGMEKGVLSRRIPDFLCICLNNDGRENAGLLEIRAADENGQPTGDWASLPETPDIDDLLSFLPESGVEAAIVGTLKSSRTDDGEPPRGARQVGTRPRRDESELEIDLTLFRGSTGFEAKSFPWRIDLANPGGSCVDLARHIAREFHLELSPRVWRRIGTTNRGAFLNFLRGLDGAACLQPDVIGDRDPKQLLMPFVEALEADPEFGLSLRRLHAAVSEAIDSQTLTREQGMELLDLALATAPADSEGTTAIGEHLVAMEELERAEQWLRLAIERPEPPVAALETLGILLANRGDTVQARNLWLTGVRVDGHPDFFAHLARLAFSEDQQDEAWDKVLRGLRRISERSLHPGEWDDDVERGGVLLRYLSEHLEEQDVTPPADVVELLVDLAAQIREPEDRLDLGLCLRLVDRPEEAKRALRAALPHVESADRRDVGAEAMVRLLFADFETRFPKIAEIDRDGEAARLGLAYLESMHAEVPQFWPALYFLGCLRETLGHDEAAYGAFRQASRLRRDQAQILARLAQSARRLERRDEAIEAVRSALELDPHNPALVADAALVLKWAGFADEARQALDDAEKLHPENPEIDAARRVLDTDEGAAPA